ncbi:MAG: hypothetical protein LBJ07_00570 [Actinomycetes bacterium]|jgi:hypothetical protein|nr:hypothetical protein [Actinomycetes bacterium]
MTDTEQKVALPEVSTSTPATEIPKAKAVGGRGNVVYIAVIAVLATLLLIVIGLFAFGRIVFLPSGSRFPDGTGGFGQGRQMTGPNGETLSEEEIEQLRSERRPPDGGSGAPEQEIP